MADLIDILHPGGDNMGGLVGFIHVCPVADIDETTLPVLSAIGKLDTAVADNLTCKSTKKFTKVYGTLGKMKLDSNSVGERDGKSIENMVEFFHPGNKQAVSEFKRAIQNTPSVLIVKDTTGNLRVLGLVNLDAATDVLTLDIPCYYESTVDTTGAASADERGVRFVFKQESPHDSIYYKGTIPLVAAV